MANKMTVAHIAAEKQFPHFTLYRPKQNGGFEYDFVKLTAFFISRGYFIYRTSVNRFVPIRIIDNIVKEVGKKDLKDEILNFLTNIDECPEYIHQFALKDISKAVSDDFLETLPEKNVEFRRDKKDAMQLYYQNCIVKITKDKITTHDYKELNGFIWESQILQRNFTIEEVSDKGDFVRFIFNLSNKDEKRYSAICSAFGFYLHNYKSPSFCPAVILNDEVISDNPEGGTGKGMFFKAVGQFIKMLKIDGKTFNFDKTFLYQRVSADTKLIFFDDVKKNFDFERLFSVITEGIGAEKKGKEEVYYEFHESPKVGVSTNYALRGGGSSHERRKLELEICQYYSNKYKPEQEFGRMFFVEWPESEWTQFDNFMVQCCQVNLRIGLVQQDLINLPEKRLMAELSPEFAEFIDDNLLQPGETIVKTAYYQKFQEMYKTSRIASRTFYSMLTKYCEFHKITLYEQKTNGVRYFVF